MTLYTRGASAYAEMLEDESAEFDSLQSLAAELRKRGSKQRDIKGKLIENLPEVVPSQPQDPGSAKWKLVMKDKDRAYTFGSHAFDQFAYKIGFPPKTLEKCPIGLAQTNVAFFSLGQGTEDFFTRLEGDKVRAFLGKGYVPVNHVEITDRLQESGRKWETNYAGLSPKRMFVLLLDPETKFKGPDGSELSHCTMVGNSETGEGSFWACDLWYDYV